MIGVRSDRLGVGMPEWPRGDAKVHDGSDQPYQGTECTGKGQH